MNGEVPSVPITTLAGIGSLTDLLPELPLPKPVPSTMHNKSLLYSSKLVEESRRILASGNTALAQQLVQSLRQTSTDHIELKDSLAGDAIEGDVPNLLKVMLATDPSIFKRRRGSERVTGHRGHNYIQQKGQQTPASPYQTNNISPYTQNSSPRVNEQSNVYVQPEIPTQAQSCKTYTVNQYPQSSETINGEHSQESFSQQRDRSRKTVSNSGQITVSSPAQGTVAESLSKRQVTQQPSSSCVPKSSLGDSMHRGSSRRQSHSCSSEPVVVLKPLNSQSKVHHTHLKESSDVIIIDSPDTDLRTRHSTRKSTEPVVLLEPLDKQVKSKFAKKDSGPVVLLEPLDAMTLQSIKFGGSVKALSDSSRQRRLEKYKNRRGKRGYSADSDNDHSNSRKRRRIYRDDSSGESEYSNDGRSTTPVEIRRKKKEKRHKRVNQGALTVDELLDSPTFKRFSSSMEYVFDSVEDVNFGSLDPDDEDVECPPESLISKSVLAELCGEAAKLKSMGVINKVPADKLVKLLTILQWNVRDGTKLLPSMTEDIEDEGEQKLWRELTMERVMRSMDSALTAIYIMTSVNMPKQVYLEDVIERLIQFGKFQLHNTIYPEFDPVYRVNPKAKGGYHSSYKLKRARAGHVKHKSTINLYNKLSDLVESLAELVEIQELTDTVILQVSTLGVSTFFVENISELQLNAMKLVTTVFSRYQKHRQLILEDIFASLARLPSSKRNLRNYRLNSEESIQMVTALALQLIQCVVKLPAADSESPHIIEDEEEKTPPKQKQRGHHHQQSPKAATAGQTDQDVVIVTSYETAMRTGHNFLSVFLKKCTIKGGEEDYRPLFENFVQDLLSTVNKPEWPSSELLLSLLGRILVQQFSNKSVDMPLRVASLEYLGIVAARLRKDAVSSQLKQEVIDEIVEKVNESGSDDEERDDAKILKSVENKKRKGQTESLQKAMLDYLAYNGHNEPAYLFARQFYIAQWYRDSTVEVEKKKKEHQKDEEDFEEEAEMEVEVVTSEIVEDTEIRKKFLLSQLDANLKPFSSFKPSPSKLDYDSSCLVARYLSSKRPFAQSFDIYLTQILRVLSETAVAVRTKAMKCLTAVVESDPGILARSDMQKGVHGRFLDQSTSVREAAVELVGKFILIRPELIPSYYDMLSERILDTGISVRKRVIKIFRDICLEQCDFNKVPEMCVKMIRRVNDEEGIKKLVNEVFQSMWFTAVSTREKDAPKLLQKVVNVTEVVAACKDTGYEFFEQLLENLLKKDEEGNYNKGALIACEQMVDCLVEHVLRIEEKSVEVNEGKGSSSRLVACLSTLYLFCKIKADLMVHHATTLQPYLDIKCNTQGDYWVLHYVARILELVVPLMEHPSESFLAQLEEDMMKLILKHGMMVLQSCVSCLGSVVNGVSNNYPLVKDCFQKFFGVLCKLMSDHKINPENPTLKNRKPTLLRSLFTVGLLCKHFDFDSKEMGEAKYCVRDKVFEVLFYFVQHEDEEVQHKALTGLGFVCVRHYDLMMGKMMRELYYQFLSDSSVLVRMRCQVLKNLTVYLTEEEVRMQKADAEWKKHAKEEDLKEMGDIQSGMASTIMQIYLKPVLEAFFHQSSQIRMAAVGVIVLVLRQGLIHPVQCVPYLLSMGTDPEAAIRIKADQQLQDIEKKYPGFIHMKALQGIKLSYRIQQLLQDDSSKPVRGVRNIDENTQSLNAYLYTVLRGNRSHRRAILTSLLNHFDDSASISLAEQVYLADNLAYFPYQSQDEPLFIIHQIDLIVSVSGSNLLQSFKEALPQKEHVEGEPRVIDDEEEDDLDLLIGKLPEDVTPFKEICRLSQGCILLLVLKQHLKDMYGFTDSKIHRYCPAELKTYDKPVNRKGGINKFNPDRTITLLSEGSPENADQNERRLKIVEDYLEFKELMLNIDPPDDDDSEDNKSTGRQTPTPRKQTNCEGGGDAVENRTGGGGEQGDVIEIHDENSTGAAAPPSKPHPDSVHPPLKTTIHLKHSRHFNSERKKKSRSRHTSGPSSASKSHSSAKKKKKRKKRYGSDNDDDYSSDDDPDFVL